MATFFRGSLPPMIFVGFCLLFVCTGASMLMADTYRARQSQAPLRPDEPRPRWVHVVGKATGEPTLRSPDGRACLLWRRTTEVRRRNRNSSYTAELCPESAASSILIEPDTGGPPIALGQAERFGLTTRQSSQLRPQRGAEVGASRCPSLGKKERGHQVERCLQQGDPVEVFGRFDPSTRTITPDSRDFNQLSAPPLGHRQPWRARERAIPLALGSAFFVAMWALLFLRLSPGWLLDLERARR